MTKPTSRGDRTNPRTDTTAPPTAVTPLRETRHLRVWLVVFLAVNAADLLTTVLVLRLGGSEANFLPAFLVAHFGAVALIPLKLAATAALSTLLMLGWRYHPTARRLTLIELRLYSIIIALVTAGNCYAIFLQFGHH